MSKEVKKWFLNKYPNNSDYVKFFLENDSVFHYDCISGNVSVKKGADQSFARPERLSELEDNCNESSIGLIEISRNVFEVELLIVVFKSFVDSLNLKKTYELKTRQMAEELSEPKYERMLRGLASILANPSVYPMKFETDLMDYLDTNYSEVFAVDKHKHTVRLQLQVVECLKKVSETMDDTIYKVFANLLAKYLEKNGPKDVDIVFNAIQERHPFIVGHIFGQNKTRAEDYTLLDFCKFNDMFDMWSVIGEDGRSQRLIHIKRPVIEEKEEAAPVVAKVAKDSDSEDIYVSEGEDNDEIYISDDELHISDEDVYISDEEMEVVSDPLIVQ